MNYDSDIESILITGGVFIRKARQKISNPITPETNVSTPVSIEDIISERYLYTLSKVIEEKLSNLTNASIGIESSYDSYSKITRLGTNFIFKLHNKQIELPVSSYFFDIWNKKASKIVS